MKFVFTFTIKFIEAIGLKKLIPLVYKLLLHQIIRHWVRFYSFFFLKTYIVLIATASTDITIHTNLLFDNKSNNNDVGSNRFTVFTDFEANILAIRLIPA